MGHLPGNAVARIMRVTSLGLAPAATARDAQWFLKENSLRYVPVLSHANGETPRLMGLVSDRDVLRALPRDLEDAESSPRGKHALETPLSELMDENPVTVAPESLLADAAQKMVDHRVDAIPVVTGRERTLVGILGATELLLRLTHRPTSEHAGKASAIMQPAAHCLGAEEPVRSAVDVMATGHFRHLPVVDGAHTLLGLVSDRDLLRHLPPLGRRPREVGTGEPRLYCDANDPETQGVLSLPISTIMRADVMTGEPHTPAAILAELMVRYRFSCVPIVASHGARLEGLVTQTDLLRLVIRLARMI